VAAIITLTTDFGTRDSYVAEMKAVILTLARGACIVDVTHEVEPQNVVEGALALDAAVPFFPPGTVHVAVVDPGVGTARRGLVIDALGQAFVGPDNGLFTPIYDRGEWRAFELRAAEYWLPTVSRTFHGRDIFAPAAAHLALGVSADRFGPPVTDPVRLPWPEARAVTGGIAGTVIHIDRFGNLVTSIDAAQVADVTGGGGGTVRVGGRALRLVETYGDQSDEAGFGDEAGEEGFVVGFGDDEDAESFVVAVDVSDEVLDLLSDCMAFLRDSDG
jgi:S-adenosylmethionine hydrolase